MTDREQRTSSDRKAEVAQTHTGQGDNVAGDKILSTSISVDDIEGAVEEILVYIRHRLTDSAVSAIGVLEGSSSLDSEAKKLLELVKILTNIAAEKNTKGYFQKFNKLRTGCKNSFSQDLATATLIRILATSNSPDFSGIELPPEREKILTREAYFEYVADTVTLIHEGKRARFDFSEPELCGLIRGLMRVGEPEIAQKLSENLLDQYHSVNSQTINIACRIKSFFKKSGVSNYWTLNDQSYSILNEICFELIRLITNTEGRDNRLLIWAANLLEFTAGEMPSLLETCSDFINTIEKNNPNIAKAIRGYNSGTFEDSDGVAFLIGKCERDEIFRNQKISEILKSDYINIEDSAILLNVGDKKRIKEWIEKGGAISEDNVFLRDFIDLELRAYIVGRNQKERYELRNKSERFIADYKNTLNDINPFRIYALCHHLLRANLSTTACKLLSFFIPDGDLWLSPLVQLYIQTLYNSKQLDTLRITLERIPRKYWNAYVWQVCAKMHETLEELPEAVDAIKKAVELGPESIDLWANLIYLTQRQGVEKSKVSAILDEIPLNILNKPSETALGLLAEYLSHGHSERVETTLIKWFLEDPDRSAKFVTDFHFSAIEIMGRNIDVRESVDDCLLAIKYKVDGNPELKLIVNSPKNKHPAFIDSESPLGEALLKSKKGEQFNIGMREYEVDEILPPYVGVFRISTDIRVSLNDGTDSFQSFSMPKDPQEFINSIKKKMQLLKKDSDPVLENPEIPIFMRGKRFDSSNPVKAMLAILFDEKFKNTGIPSFGTESYKKIILDIWSITYIFYAGLSESFKSRGIDVVITRETKSTIESWVSDVNRDDYLTIDITQDGDLIRTRCEEIYNSTIDLQEWMRFILETCEIQSPKLVDLPEKINECLDLIDESVKSSIILAFSNHLDWMSIDPFFARLLSGHGGRVVNVSFLSVQLGADRDIDSVAFTFQLHLIYGFPCSITTEDLIQLAFSQQVTHDEILKDLLTTYQDALSCVSGALPIIVKVCTANLISALRAGERIDSDGRIALRHGSGTLSVFYNCCFIASLIQYDNQKLSREERLARFFVELFDRFYELPSVVNFVRRAGSVYTRGHFLRASEINRCLVDLQSGARDEA